MKQFFSITLAVLALVCLSHVSRASHIAGADISVAYISADTINPTGARIYRLTLNLFRDCGPGSAGLGNSASVCRFNACGINDTYTLTRLPGYPLDVSQVCPDPNFTSECTGGTIPGYELHRYQADITIDNPVVNQTTPCESYTFGWSGCCRNAGIANILNSSSQGIQVSLEYFFDADFENNTPEFVSPFPLAYRCFTLDSANLPFPHVIEQTVPFSAIETQGDSIVYFDASAQGGGCNSPTPLAYINTNNGGAYDFSPTNAFASLPGTNVNLTSGIVSFYPVSTGFYVMVVEFQEYDPDTDELLSRGTRDIQVVVEVCTNRQPVDQTGITNLQGQANAADSLTLELCIGETFSFDVVIEDRDSAGNLSNDSLTLFADSLQAVMPGALLTHTETNPDTINITWTAVAGTSPFFGFVVTISDNACPIPGVTDLNFNVRIKPSAQISAADVICLGDTIRMISRFGNVIGWDVVEGDPLVEGVNYFPNDSMDTVFVIPTRDSRYALNTDLQTCSKVDSHSVRIDTRDADIFADDLYCFNQTPEPVFTAATPGGVWSGPGIHPSTGILDLNEVDPGPRVARDTISIAYTFISPSGCLSTDTVRPVVANFNAVLDSLPPLCAGDSNIVNLKDWSYFDFGEFLSIPNGDALALGSNLTDEGLVDVNGLDVGAYAITHILDTVCAVRFDSILIVSPKPDAKIIDFEEIYCTHDDDSVFFTAASDSGYWGGNAITDPTTGAMIPNQVGAGTYALSYFAVDPITRCSSEDVVTFKISHSPPRPRVLYEGPFCEGDRLSDLTADGLRTNSYRWYTGPTASEDSLLYRGRRLNVGELTESLDLYVTQTNEDGCESFTSYQWIEVVKLPVVDFDADPWEGIRLPLEVNFANLTDTAQRYAWDFGDGFASNEENPDAHIFQELGIYNVTLWADNGVCQNSITKAIIADAEVLINIPNVFTPNSDGFNDKWAPEWDNIDQANVQVFNRWGQQVYEFEEPSDGWDGGNQKDGVYFYILRGIEHSLSAKPIQYSGDITLIRGE